MKLKRINALPKGKEIQLPASKSIANRALIIQALSKEDIVISNLSNARDTQTMLQLLQDEGQVKDVKDAGTTMRFLTAFYALQNDSFILQGTERMHQRPIGILVDALRSLGAQINYLGEEAYPPLEIHPFQPINACQELVIDSSISSQYISALLMVAPLLPNGLFFKLQGKTASKPYINMTLELMQQFGITLRHYENKIRVNPGRYSGGELKVENDWSAASYWYSFLILSDLEELYLPGLQENSLQGDAVIAAIATVFGIETSFDVKGAILKKEAKEFPTELKLNVQNCPDLAQTLAVLCGVTGVELHLDGIHSLRIKETDRVKALQSELARLDIAVEDLGESIKVHGKTLQTLPKNLSIATYEDHRMAMSFAPLVHLGELEIQNQEVVAKSYPNFWEELQKMI
ncbi:3-phosphoshikimate 1-carboxyvinyltransferase [Lishizhenia tianjinensis]|uniref:3-phosphoshikimate 1-carboxyvinyltransferase n=1 Tax=Lishizhenia tianjinensis TaxID=477690 RepID=A0A1I7A1K2_9FLAO|nr:3-phosphoshikimate 1-carboxyvinyltransferase [Lishizhenia tianjinensis]SFT68771.1 3-phosphoshikimate 1-carboxyvinyltransferase [Lishizhenia tianjinensis]